jgi:hypothetical protein
MADAVDAVPREWIAGGAVADSGSWTRHLPECGTNSARATDSQDGASASDWKYEEMNINFPFEFDGRGQTASCNESEHIRQMLEELIFTSPVNGLIAQPSAAECCN